MLLFYSLYMPNTRSTTMEEELNKDDFRIAIFGSARIQREDDVYQDTTKLAQKLASEGVDIVSGGGPGLMEAANLGQVLSKNPNTDSIGLTIELPFENSGNKYLNVKKHFQKFSNRLDHFMELSNAVVVMPGGIGTCLEFFYTLQLTQVKHICHIPIILVGGMWKELHEWILAYPVGSGLASIEDLDNVFPVEHIEDAFTIIMKTKKEFEAGGTDACMLAMKNKFS